MSSLVHFRSKLYVAKEQPASPVTNIESDRYIIP